MNRRTEAGLAVVAVAVTVALAASIASGADKPPPPRAADGFVIGKVAGDPQVRFPMFAAFDDRGRLFVAESSGLDLYAELRNLTHKCRVSVLEDRDGDGVFEHAHVFADGLVFPMGLAWRDGKLYVADPPQLVTLQDTDGDGCADQRTVVLDGFGHQDNGSLHGLTFGPDGWLYMTMGQPDGYRLARADGRVLTGRTGALLRCRADGSDPQVLARGFENLVEIAFAPTGEILGTDNWFYLPRNGVRDAIMHLVDGGRYPHLEEEAGREGLITGDALPPITRFPAVALSGLMRYRGQAFPAEMRGNLFSAQHNARRVQRHVLSRQGATFSARDVDFVTSDDPDFHPSDVLEDADGSLLVVDTGGWYVQHCPTGRIRNSGAPGGIYRVRYKGAARVDDAFGVQLDWRAPAQRELIVRLGDDRWVVRDRARDALVQRGAGVVAALAQVAQKSADVRAQRQAVWALSAIGDAADDEALRALLAGGDADMLALAARALARRGDRAAAPALHKLLLHEQAPVRLAAAEALATCGSNASVQPLVDALAGKQVDPFEEHALIYALHHAADRPALQRALTHTHTRVQKAALWLLEQPPHQALTPQAVAARVASTDEALRRAAVTILQRHPDWADEAAAVMRRWIATPQLQPQEQQALADYVLAFGSHRPVIELVARTVSASDGSVDATRRALLVEAISRSTLADVPAPWANALSAAVNDKQAAVRAAAVRAVAVLQITTLDEPLGALADDASQPADLRVTAVRALIGRHPSLSPGRFNLLIGQLDRRVGAAQRMSAMQVLGRARLNKTQAQRLLAAVRGDPVIAPDAVLAAVTSHGVTANNTPLSAELLEYLAQSIDAGWQVSPQSWRPVLQRARTQQKALANQLLGRLDAQAAQQKITLTKYDRLLTDGDAQRGRALFFGKATCFACHRIGDQGGSVGPDLTRIGTVRSGRDLVESIALPSATFAQGYEAFLVVTTDGASLLGVVARQSPQTVVLRDASGAELRVRRDQIDRMDRAKRSLMPDGLLQALSDEEARDLLAFLQNLK